jgi:hypothetical protein
MTVAGMAVPVATVILRNDGDPRLVEPSFGRIAVFRGPLRAPEGMKPGSARDCPHLSVISVLAAYEGGMDDLLSLGPALVVPVLTGAWLAAAALVAVFVGRAVRLADRRSTRPASK